MYNTISSLIFNVYSNNLYHCKVLYEIFPINPSVSTNKKLLNSSIFSVRTNELSFTTNCVTCPTNSKLNQHALTKSDPTLCKTVLSSGRLLNHCVQFSIFFRANSYPRNEEFIKIDFNLRKTFYIFNVLIASDCGFKGNEI